MKTILSLLFFALIGEIMADRTRRMIGATPISIEEAAYFVSMRKNGAYHCGGALITRKHVLTAAHCILDTLGLNRNMTVLVGTDQKNIGGTSHQIQKMLYPPTYRVTDLKDDIAVIVLTEYVTLGEKVKVIALPGEEPNYDETARLIAFETPTAPHRNSPLHQLETHVFPVDQCLVREAKSNPHHADMFCGTIEDSQAITRGDSGSPLIQNGKIVGVVSWLSVVGNKLTYYTNVRRFSTFINKAKRCLLSTCVIT